MARTRVDVAVVGASLAGLRAARTAAEAGAEVLVLERREAVGEPPSPAIVAFDFLWPVDLLLPERLVRRRLPGVRVASPAGHALDVEAPLRLLRRPDLDCWLATDAERAGATLRAGVRHLAARSDRTLVADGEKIGARVVVFADGARTLATRFLQPVSDPRALAWGAVQALEAPDEARVHLGVGRHLAGGRSQLNPLGGDAWTHWTFWRGAPREAPRLAREALARDARRLGWSAAAVESARFEGVAPDPVFTIPRRLVADGVVVAGGAAGQAGIEPGLASGALAGAVAGAAAREGDARAARLAAYERAWMSRHLAGYRGLRRAVDRLAAARDADLDALVAAWTGQPIPVERLARLAAGPPLSRLLAAAQSLAQNPRALAPAARIMLRARP